jgi:hypothetical protein
MGIRFRCECARFLEVDEELVGRPVRCPVCGAVVRVPPPAEGLPKSLADDIPLSADELYGQEPAGPGPAVTPDVPRPSIEEVESPGAPFVVDEAAPPPLPAVAQPGKAGAAAAWGPSTEWRRRAEEVEREYRLSLKRYTLPRTFLDAMAFPLAGSGGWYTLLMPLPLIADLLVLPLLASEDPKVVIVGALLGVPVLIGTLVFLFGWLTEVVRAAAESPRTPPDWAGRDFITERIWPGVKVLAHFFLVVFLPSAAVASVLHGFRLNEAFTHLGRFFDLPAQRFFFVLLAVYYVMSATVLMALGSFRESLRPRVVLRAIVRAPGEYALTLGFGVALAAFARWFPDWLAEHVEPEASLIWPLLAYYCLCVAMARMGFLAYRKRYQLGWAHRQALLPQELPAVAQQIDLTAAPGDLGGETDEWVRFRCTCGRVLSTPMTSIGFFTVCPSCKRRTMVPAPGGHAGGPHAPKS